MFVADDTAQLEVARYDPWLSLIDGNQTVACRRDHRACNSGPITSGAGPRGEDRGGITLLFSRLISSGSEILCVCHSQLVATNLSC